MGPVMVDTVGAQVEPVPGRDGWFQLTGARIVRAVAFDEFMAGVHRGEDSVVPGARVIGFHDQATLMRDDARFNGQSPEACRVIRRADGDFIMVLEIHAAEATLLRFVLPASQPARDDPLPRASSAD